MFSVSTVALSVFTGIISLDQPAVVQESCGPRPAVLEQLRQHPFNSGQWSNAPSPAQFFG